LPPFHLVDKRRKDEDGEAQQEEEHEQYIQRLHEGFANDLDALGALAELYDVHHARQAEDAQQLHANLWRWARLSELG
jgi:hypothetical protein